MNGKQSGRRLWAWPWELQRAGVVGINARNRRFVAEENLRRLYPRVDDKLLTKQLCRDAGLPVPATWAVIARYGDVKRLDVMIGPRQEFVLKPAMGSGGRGVLVIVSCENGRFQTAGGHMLDGPQMRYQVASMLSGLYSLGGQPDRVIVEERIRPHPAFRDIAAGGTPDIRVLCHRFAPSMAMLRLPTQASRGRANLHQGAVGVGVDMVSGRTRGGVWRDRRILLHPDSGAPVVDLSIPYWPEIPAIVERLCRAVGLGYLGVDLVIAEDRGPVILEANARPGLSIQIANQCGLSAAELGVPRKCGSRIPDRS